MIELLLALTIWNLISIILFIAVIVVLSEFDRPFSAALTVIAVAIALWYFYGFNPIDWMWNNPGTTVGSVISYLLIGGGWSVYKWDRFVAERKKEYDEYKPDPARPNDVRYHEKAYGRPDAFDYKHKFTTWIMWWWASMIVYLFDDLFTEIRDAMMRILSQLYTKTVDRHYGPK